MSEFNDITYQRDDIYCFDIDGTLCDTPPNVYPWNDATPRMSRIKKVNKLYDEGATIYLMTARGFIYSTKKHEVISEAQTAADDFAREKTEKQLESWGLKYHRLYFGKPRAVTYVDDRGVGDHEFFQD